MAKILNSGLLILFCLIMAACASAPADGQSLSNARGSCYTFMGHGERSCPNQTDICDQALGGLEAYDSEQQCLEVCDERHRRLTQKYPLSCNYVVKAGYGKCRDYCRGLDR
jgi:hypothetical protein